MMTYSSKMQAAKKSIKEMTLEEHLEYNRQFIRKLRETEEYQQQEKEYREKYYEENKEKLSAKGREKIRCTCGCTLSRNSLSRHKKSQQHMKSQRTSGLSPKSE